MGLCGQATPISLVGSWRGILEEKRFPYCCCAEEFLSNSLRYLRPGDFLKVHKIPLNR